MKHFTRLLPVSALALLIATPAFSQGALVGIDSLDDQIDDNQDDITDDLNEGDDSLRRGNNQFAPGWTGTFSLGLSATDGNTDTRDLNAAGRLRYGNGP